MIRIRFGDIRIGTVSGTSGIFSGSNEVRDFRHDSKANQAFGTVGEGRNLIADATAVVRDGDRIDAEIGGKPRER